MIVKVDPARCTTAGVCVRECPEVFRFTWGDKKAEAYRNPVPKLYEESCRKAAASCPEGAIIVQE